MQPSHPTLIHRRVEEARDGRNPRVIARVPSGWVVLGDVQFLRGYSLLLPDPVVSDLNALSLEARAEFHRDLALIGDSLIAVTGAARVNYEILGNLEPALHAHLFPRFPDDEPEHLKTRPAWFYDWSVGPAFDRERDQPLMRKIGEDLAKRLRALGLSCRPA